VCSLIRASLRSVPALLRNISQGLKWPVVTNVLAYNTTKSIAIPEKLYCTGQCVHFKAKKDIKWSKKRQLVLHNIRMECEIT
jgi:hypothetical protein